MGRFATPNESQIFRDAGQALIDRIAPLVATAVAINPEGDLRVITAAHAAQALLAALVDGTDRHTAEITFACIGNVCGDFARAQGPAGPEIVLNALILGFNHGLRLKTVELQ